MKPAHVRVTALLSGAVRAVAATRPPHLPPWLRVASAPAAVLLAVLVQLAILPHPHVAPFVFLFLGVAAASWLAGRAAGLVAVGLAALVGNYCFVDPDWAWSLSPAALVATGLFMLSASAVAWLSGSLRDAVEELRRSEQSLRESRADLDRAQAVARTGSWRLDVGSSRLLWSDETYRIFGIPAGSALTYEQFLAAVHPDDRDYVNEQWAAATLGHPYDIEHRIIVGETVKWVRERAEVELDSEGSVRAALGTVQDITERKQVEQGMARAKEEWERTFDSVPDLIALLDDQRRILRVNKAMADRLGKCPPVGQASVPEVPGTQEPLAFCPYTQTVADGQSHTVHVHEEREDNDFLVTTTPLRGPDGRTVGVVHIARDVTEQKRGERALQEANRRLVEADRRKDEFLGILSHELRNPLTPIRTSLYILERAAPSGEQAARARAVIDRQVGHLARLVDDLLDVTRISRGKIQLQRERLCLDDIVRRAVEDLRPVFAQNEIELSLELPREPLVVLADATRMEQVVGNLLQNASKFTPPGGRTSVSMTRDEERHAVVVVRDTGTGIAAEMLTRVFEPFAQADKTLARTRGGLGLGLALVKGIIELHGGSVTAHSDGLGRGAEFRVRLPLAAEAEAARSSGPVAAAPCGCLRVLVIEDNMDGAVSLRDALRSDGHEVEVAGEGEEGLRKVRAFQPDVVFCDIGLPGRDGYEVARAIRREPAAAPVLLVALTGYALPEDIAKAKAAGFDHHLAKPPSFASIQALLAQAAQCRRPRQVA